MKKFFVIICGLVFLWNSSLWAQGFEAKVNRNQIPEGETFLLTLELAGVKSDKTPDLSVLNNDFTTYSVSNAFRTNIINGQVSQSRQWNLVLMPNKTGKLTIPALELEGYQSKPITIEVAPAGSEMNVYDKKSPTQEASSKFSISGQVNNKNPYVQEQIIYTLKLNDRGGLQGEEPYFEGEGADDWIIKSLGAPKVNSQIINGQTNRELVFKYALFPQKSGNLTIPAAKFRGFYLTKKSRKDPFEQFFSDDIFLSGFGMTDVFATKNPVLLSTKPIDVKVKAANSQNGEWWLPAQEVVLEAHFDEDKPKFKVGEAITRTFYLRAVGVIDSQMPEIKFPQINELRQYPEKPETVMKVEDNQVVSLMKVANVYIPSQGGEITLPAVTVPWFNVKTNRAEVAQIPAQKIKVSGETATKPIIDTNTTTTAVQPNETEQIEVVNSLPQNKVYALLGGAFVLGILICYILMKLFSRKREASAKINSIKEIHQAAASKDLRRLRDALLFWAKDRYPEAQIFSLSDVENQLQNQPFSCELQKLSEALYAAKEANWNAEMFLKTFEKVNKTKVKKKNDSELLPKLYK